MLISHFQYGYYVFPYDVVQATKRGDGGVLVAIFLHLINVRTDTLYTCYDSLWVEIGKFYGSNSLLETITFLVILSLTFYPIYCPFRKITYTKNLHVILTADISVLLLTGNAACLCMTAQPSVNLKKCSIKQC